MSGFKTSESMLGDFRTNWRMLLLVALALPLGVFSAFVAKALLWLIAEISNLVFFQRFSSQLPALEHHHLGAWVILAPVAGALIIGLMARYGFAAMAFLKRSRRSCSAAA
jgi:chloride channel protein, CIC family